MTFWLSKKGAADVPGKGMIFTFDVPYYAENRSFDSADWAGGSISYNLLDCICGVKKFAASEDVVLRPRSLLNMGVTNFSIIVT